MRKVVWTHLLALLFGAGVFVAPYRPVADVGTVLATTPTAHHTGHAQSSQEPKPTSTHHHSPRCVLCVVGAGVLPALVRVVRVERLTLAERPLGLPDTRPRTFRLFRSRAPPLKTIRFAYQL